jgi:hypothetical protein
MNILVNVINQKLKIKANTKRLVSGTQKFIRFEFNLDDAWDNLLVFAQFIQNGKAYNDYLDENNSVYLPDILFPSYIKQVSFKYLNIASRFLCNKSILL